MNTSSAISHPSPPAGTPPIVNPATSPVAAHPTSTATIVGSTDKPRGRSLTTYILTGLAGLGLIILGVLVSRIFSSYPAENRSAASTGTGTAAVTISPSTKTLNAGESSSVAISFDTGGNSISGIAVRIQYSAPLIGTTPALTVSNFTPIITQTNTNWVCPVKSIQNNGTNVTLDLGCLYQTTTAFSAPSSTALATFTITAGQTQTASPIIISFDPTATVITQKSDGKDVAAIPQGSAHISIVSTSPTSSPTPTLTATPTPTSTVTPTPTPTTASGNPTATPTPTVTPTPTPGSSFTSSANDGLKKCNETCTTNRDCAAELSCAGGVCRATRCPSDQTCGCQNQKVGANGLPDSGSTTITTVLSILGILFILGGSSLLIARKYLPIH